MSRDTKIMLIISMLLLIIENLSVENYARFFWRFQKNHLTLLDVKKNY
jgi:hypothetical protein